MKKIVEAAGFSGDEVRLLSPRFRYGQGFDMARILITGGAGYVGSHCVKALYAAGHECIVFDNLIFGHREFVRWGELIEGDIRDSAALDAAFSTKRVEAVMHFAALAYVGESVSSPGRYYGVNVHGTGVLLDAMVRANCCLLVQLRGLW